MNYYVTRRFLFCSSVSFRTPLWLQSLPPYHYSGWLASIVSFSRHWSRRLPHWSFFPFRQSCPETPSRLSRILPISHDITSQYPWDSRRTVFSHLLPLLSKPYSNFKSLCSSSEPIWSVQSMFLSTLTPPYFLLCLLLVLLRKCRDLLHLFQVAFL